jgi:hypothetical protein
MNGWASWALMGLISHTVLDWKSVCEGFLYK